MTCCAHASNGWMAMVYFFDMSSLEFIIRINFSDKPCNKASLLAGRC